MVEKSSTFDRICTKRCGMDKTRNFLKTLDIPENRYIVVGCSGGPDSMCLLDVLMSMGYRVVCAHVNHNLRAASKDEATFLQKYCEDKQIPFELLELDEELHENESYYRRERYTFYKKLADTYNTHFIATAHHGDDLVETILMRLSRGSRLKGYAGFLKIYDEGPYHIIKPLIFYTKDDILAYDRTHDIPFVHDHTNDEDEHTRNRYRHYCLPFLKRENKNVHLKYLKYSEELAAASLYIERETDMALTRNYEEGKLIVSKFLKEDPYIQKKELEHILKNIYRDDIDKIADVHIDSILELALKGTNFTLDLPLGHTVSREYDYITFDSQPRKPAYEFELTNQLLLPNGDCIEAISTSEDMSNYTTRLNTGSLTLPLYIRTRRAGDRMAIKNMNGSKKIADILIDEKIPPSLRDTIPILTDASQTILWLPGIKKSKFDINKGEKYDIILRYTKRKENTDEKK